MLLSPLSVNFPLSIEWSVLIICDSLVAEFTFTALGDKFFITSAADFSVFPIGLFCDFVIWRGRFPRGSIVSLWLKEIFWEHGYIFLFIVLLFKLIEELAIDEVEVSPKGSACTLAQMLIVLFRLTKELLVLVV